MSGSSNQRKRDSAPNGLSSSLRENQPAQASLPSPAKRKKRIILNRGQVYDLLCERFGNFRIRGGFTGGLHVIGSQVIIQDLYGEEIYSDGGVNQVTTLTDDNSGTVVVNRHDGLAITPSNEMLQIVADKNTDVILKGLENRHVLINGNGGYLQTFGRMTIRLRGSLQKVTHEGPRRVDITPEGLGPAAFITESVQNNGNGALVINGSTSGRVINKGERGVIAINGRVQGEVKNENDGAVIVHGAVTGNVCQAKNGCVFVEGSVDGDLIQTGNGVISVIGAVGGTHTIKGHGTVHYFKTSQSKAEVYRNSSPVSDSPPDIATIQVNGLPASVVLEKGKLFRFKSTPVGSFRIRSGLTGNIQVRDNRVTLVDSKGKVVFSGGAKGDIVNVEDTPDGSVVTLMAGGDRIERNPQRRASMARNIPGFFTGDSTQETFKYTLPLRTLQVVTGPGEEIILSFKDRGVYIHGGGGHLTTHGPVRVQVEGFLDSVDHLGSGKVTIKARVAGSVTNSGEGFTSIEGDVKGNIICKGGLLSVFGEVGGSIRQSGGTAIVHGDVEGGVRHENTGTAIIRGKVRGDVDKTGNGALILIGGFNGKASITGGGLIHHYNRGTDSNNIYLGD